MSLFSDYSAYMLEYTIDAYQALLNHQYNEALSYFHKRDLILEQIHANFSTLPPIESNLDTQIARELLIYSQKIEQLLNQLSNY